MSLAIINLGISNIKSVEHAFDRLGVGWKTVQEPEQIGEAKVVVLPGVGSFPDGMARLRQRGFAAPLRDLAQTRNRPILGICLGMQLLAEWGDEHGVTQGLGLIPGRVERLDPGQGERIPNIGWCHVEATPGSTLMSNLVSDPTFYFVHSYHFRCACEANIAATFRFGNASIVAAVEHGSLFGVQFHPEKSQDAGMEFLDRFMRSVGLL